MIDIAEKREGAVSLMFIGLAVWVADLLVVFFLPSATRLGREATFYSIIAVLAIFGLVLIVTGYARRQSAGEEE